MAIGYVHQETTNQALQISHVLRLSTSDNFSINSISNTLEPQNLLSNSLRNFTFSNDTDISICNKPLSKRYLALAFFSGVVAIMGFVGNIIAISVFILSKQFRERISNSFLVSLAVADLGVTAFVTTVKVDKYYHNNSFCHGPALCTFAQITDSLFPITSITHLLALCVDRWYAVTKPYEYRKLASRRRVVVTIVCIWAYSLIWTMLGVLKWEHPVTFAYKVVYKSREMYCYNYNRNYMTTLSVIIYFIPMCVLMKLSTNVVRLARKKSMQCAAHAKPKGRKLSTQKLGIGSKAVRTVGAVSVAFIICWLPHFVIVVIQYWWMHVLVNFSRFTPTTYDIVTTIINNILPTLSSCLNPFIYCLFSEQFRIEFSDLMRRWMGRPRYWAHMYSEEENVALYTIPESEVTRDCKISLPSRTRPKISSCAKPATIARAKVQRNRSYSI